MSTLVRCKACGYIMEASALGAVCPACGVPASMFEPYDDKVKEGRRKLIDLHIHPVIVHAPQAFALALLVLAFLMAFVAGPSKALMTDAARFLGAALPLTVIAAFLSGLYDAKLRFRKTNTPQLQKKKLFGLLFFLSSLGVGAMALWSPLDTGLLQALFGLFSGLGLGFGAILGLLGTPLLIAKFPG